MNYEATEIASRAVAMPDDGFPAPADVAAVARALRRTLWALVTIVVAGAGVAFCVVVGIGEIGLAPAILVAILLAGLGILGAGVLIILVNADLAPRSDRAGPKKAWRAAYGTGGLLILLLALGLFAWLLLMMLNAFLGGTGTTPMEVVASVLGFALSAGVLMWPGLVCLAVERRVAEWPIQSAALRAWQAIGVTSLAGAAVLIVFSFQEATGLSPRSGVPGRLLGEVGPVIGMTLWLWALLGLIIAAAGTLAACRKIEAMSDSGRRGFEPLIARPQKTLPEGTAASAEPPAPPEGRGVLFESLDGRQLP